MAFGAFVTGFLGYAFAYRHFAIDDAFINLRYARNVLAGQGLVFNPGEHVEGFTSPFVVVLETAFFALGLPVLPSVKVVGLLCGVAIVGMTMALTLEVIQSQRAVVLSGLILLVQPWFALDCLNGLDSALFAAATTAALLTYARSESRLLTGGWLALSVLIRPEGALLALLLAVHASLSRSIRDGVLLLAPMVVCAGPLLAWKSLYYDGVVPNTALAKVPSLGWARIQSGLEYLLEFAPARWDAVALLSLILVGRRISALRILTSVVVCWLAYVVFVGGDWMGPQRFLMPVQPLLAVGLTAGAWSTAQWVTARYRSDAAIADIGCGIAATGLVLASSWTSFTDLRLFLQGVERGTQTKMELAGWLKQASPEGATVATFDVGVLAEQTGLRMIDTGGLTDKPIAMLLHAGPADYAGHLAMPTRGTAVAISREVMRRQPELVLLNIWGSVPDLLENLPQRTGRYRYLADHAYYVADAALLANPEFGQSYRWACSRKSVQDENGSFVWYNLFVRKDAQLRLPPSTDDRGRAACQF